MNNVTNLFENLLMMNESSNRQKNYMRNRALKENDSTMLNLSIELPQDTENITPDDVDVNVGVMNLDTNDVDSNVSNDDSDLDDDFDEGPDNISNGNSNDVDFDGDDIDEDEDKEDNKKQTKKDKDDADKKLDNKDKDKKESFDLNDADVNAAKKRIRQRANSKMESNKLISDEMKDLIKQKRAKKTTCTDCKESTRLDNHSLNRLLTGFVRDNYKNINKITVSKAVLENNELTIKGTITDIYGKNEAIILKNRGFNPVKLEGKRFLMNFKDISRTFNVMKEGVKQPFIFTATLKNGVLKFESLKCDFKTKLRENKIAQITGKYSLDM